MIKYLFLVVSVIIFHGCSDDKSNDNKLKDTAACEVGDGVMKLDNGILKVKLDLTRGGAISYISKTGTSRNLVNIYDEGRYIQQSYYAGKSVDRTSEGQSPDWSPWSWNPIQVGDAYGNRAEVLECKNTDNTLYVKCIPMQWDMNNRPAEGTMEQWLTLTGNVIKVTSKLTCKRTDDIYGDKVMLNQELPAVYPISALSKLYSYFGSSPFSGEAIEELEVKHLEDGFWGRYEEEQVSEHWMAFVDDNLWGMGVYTPISSNFLAGMAGSHGGESDHFWTSYIAPLKDVALAKVDVFEYDYYIVIGSVDEIRSEIYKIEESIH